MTAHEREGEGGKLIHEPTMYVLCTACIKTQSEMHNLLPDLCVIMRSADFTALNLRLVS